MSNHPKDRYTLLATGTPLGSPRNHPHCTQNLSASTPEELPDDPGRQISEACDALERNPKCKCAVKFARALESLLSFPAASNGLDPELPATMDESLQGRIMKSLLILLDHCRTSQEVWLSGQFGETVRTIVCRFVCERVLSEHLLGESFREILENCLEPRCSQLTRAVVGVFLVAMEKLSGDSCTSLLTKGVVFKLRHVVLRVRSGLNDPFFLELERCYEELEIESLLRAWAPSWGLLLDSLALFQRNRSNLRGALETLSRALVDDSFCLQQLIQSDLLAFLEDLLFVSSPRKSDDDDVETFLRVFLRIDEGYGDECVQPSPEPFEKLVGHLVSAIAYQIHLATDTIRDSSSEGLHVDGLKVINLMGKDVKKSLNVLNCLHSLNSTWYQWFDVVSAPALLDGEAFVCRNLPEASGGAEPARLLETWIGGLIKFCPAAFPFPLRYEIFKSVLKARSSGSKAPLQTFLVSRDRLLSKVKELFDRHPGELLSKWSFEFENELGTGLGPTKEVYSTLSLTLQRHCLDLWRGEPMTSPESAGGFVYTHSDHGLYPMDSQNSKRSLMLFRFFGKLMAKALLDGHLLDVPLSEEFFRRLLQDSCPHLRRDQYYLHFAFPSAKRLIQELIWIKGKKRVIQTDCTLSEEEKKDRMKFLKFKDGSSFDDLMLDFAIPGGGEELLEGGSDITLSILNFEEYLAAMCEKKSKTHPLPQFEAIRAGFGKILPVRELNLFLPEELKTLVCGELLEEWNVDYLRSSISVRGFSPKSESVRNFYEALCSMSGSDRRKFLMFATSSPVLPPGGLKNLSPPLNILRMGGKGVEARLLLPCASTCFNSIHLPEYEKPEVVKERLLYALREGGNSFQFM